MTASEKDAYECLETSKRRSRMSSDESDCSIGESRNSVNNGFYTSEDERRVLILPPMSAPKDRFHLVYIAIYLLGISSLLPWNFFITVTQYFNYKFRNVSLPLNMSSDVRYLTHMAVTFESDLAIANQIPTVIIQLAVIFLLQRASVKTLLTSSIVVTFVMFGITTAFVKIDTDMWQGAFFAVTLAIVVVLSGASAVTQSALFGLAATLPQKYTQAIMGGMGLGGVVSAAANILTLSIGSDVVESALWYFLIAEFFVLASLVGYLYMYRVPFAIYHRDEFKRILLETNAKHQLVEGAVNKRRLYFTILKKIGMWAFSVALTFFATLAIFPSITANVHSVNEGDGSQWTSKFFVPVYCFGLFNINDLGGRTVAGWYTLPRPRVTVPILAIARLAFVPLFMLCNVLPRHSSLPVVFDSDVYPIVFMILFAFSNGYLSTVAMMQGPTSVNKEQAEIAGTIMSFMITFGLGLGSAISYLFIEIV